MCKCEHWGVQLKFFQTASEHSRSQRLSSQHKQSDQQVIRHPSVPCTAQSAAVRGRWISNLILGSLCVFPAGFSIWPWRSWSCWRSWIRTSPQSSSRSNCRYETSPEARGETHLLYTEAGFLWRHYFRNASKEKVSANRITLKITHTDPCEQSMSDNWVITKTELDDGH